MAGQYRYNTYGPGRTRPMSPEEAHWRNMGIRFGLQMRRAPKDPLHKMTHRENMGTNRMFRGKKQAEAAVLTPH